MYSSQHIVHCIGIGKTSSSVLHGQVHPQDFPPERSAPINSLQGELTIKESTDEPNNLQAFRNGSTSSTGEGKVRLLEDTHICNLRGFSIQISIKKQRRKCTPLRTPANTVNLIRS